MSTAPARALAMRAALLRRLSSLGRRAASASSSASSSSSAQAQATAAAAGLPADARRVLAASGVALGVFTDTGRALVARRPLALGEVLLEEMPVAAAPSPERDPGAQCHHCLRLLPAAAPPREPAIRQEEEQEEGDEAASSAAAAAARGVGESNPPTRRVEHERRGGGGGVVTFCGEACALAAEASYFRVERRVDWAPLREHCAAQRERFPLVAARLACGVLQAWESGGGRKLTRPAAAAAAATAAALSPGRDNSPPEKAEEEEEEEQDGIGALAAAAAASQLGPMPAVAYLCRANLFPTRAEGGRGGGANPPPLPAAWQRSHALLVRALGEMLDAEPGGASSSAAAARLLPAVRAVCSPGWYAGVLSRLHLNSFRVEAAATAALTAAAAAAGAETAGDQDAAAAATDTFTAALRQAASASPASQALGSAVYSVSSLANHSCDPNASAAWPRGDARLRLTARRDVAPGEQVTISYIDASLAVEERRALLEHGYGFVCRCPRCEEEEARGAA